MGYLTTEELDSLRAHFGATMPDTCVVEYVTHTNNGDGTTSESWATRGTMDCRMVPVTSRDFPALTAEQVKEGQYFTLVLSGTAIVTPSDRMTVNGATYYAKQVNSDASERLVTRALVERRV